MPIETKIGSAWKTLDTVEVKIGSAWKSVDTVEVKIGSVWKEVFTRRALALTALDSSFYDPTPAYSSTVGIRLLTTGDVEEYLSSSTWTAQNSGTEWINDLTGVSASDYECYLSGTGTTPSGPALNTWHTISATQQWTITRTTAGTSYFSGTLQIREIADTANTVSAAVTLSATNGV